MHLQILPAVQGRAVDLEFYYINLLQRFKWALLMGGERVLVYQRRWTGERCPNWDPIRKQHRLDQTDDVCHGTGYVGGYYRPVEIFVSLLSATNIQNVVQEEGIRKFFKPTSWTLANGPLLRNGDFIVRKNGERLWVKDITPTRWRGQHLRFLFSTDLVEKDHPIYRIPV